jgi:hypothetical protein
MNSTTYTSADHVGSVRAALLRLAGSQLSGTQLRALVDSTCPGFDLRAAAGVPTGPGALSSFLRTHFSDLVHMIGKQGGDNLYLIGAPRSDLVVTDVAAPPVGFWAAFASPGLGQEIVFDRVHKSLSVQAKGVALSEHQVRLAPISSQEFRTIAAQFVESAPTDIQDELRKILEEGDLFYQNWISILKRRDPAVYHRWGLFRVRSIIDLFRVRLATAEVPLEEVEKGVQSLVADQAAAYKERAHAIRSSIQPLQRPVMQPALNAPGPASGASDMNDARALVVAVINNMSLTEIRQISVPLGAIIDASILFRK